jgi:hypothetical protein
MVYFMLVICIKFSWSGGVRASTTETVGWGGVVFATETGAGRIGETAAGLLENSLKLLF